MQGFDDIFLVLTAFIHMSLVSIIHLDSKALDRGLEFLLKIFGIGSFLRAERIRRIRIRHPDIFLHTLVHFLHINGNLPNPVIFVP